MSRINSLFTEEELRGISEILGHFGYSIRVETVNGKPESKLEDKPESKNTLGKYYIKDADNQLRLKVPGYNNLDISKKEIVQGADGKQSFLSVEFTKRKESARDVNDCRILIGLPESTKKVTVDIKDGILYATASVEVKKPSIEIV